MTQVIIGLGANIGDRKQYLRQAVEALAEIAEVNVKALSSLYQSPAMLTNDAPEAWNKPFLNMAICIETSLGVYALLSHLQHIEKTLGKQKRGVWAPREIDLDILAFGEEVIIEDSVSIPHTGLLVRDFALIPFAELWPDWCYPVDGEHVGKTAKILAGKMAHTTLRCIGQLYD